jgi:hypothetical protein
MDECSGQVGDVFVSRFDHPALNRDGAMAVVALVSGGDSILLYRPPPSSAAATIPATCIPCQKLPVSVS